MNKYSESSDKPEDKPFSAPVESNDKIEEVNKNAGKLKESKLWQKAGQSPQKTNSSFRRHSIKDLFGNSDDEGEKEEESENRRKGSGLNLQPVKMSIVLKNNITKKDNEEQVQSRPEYASESAPQPTKWMAVDHTSVPDSTTATNKWKAIESSEEKVESNIEEPTDAGDKWKPIESMDVSEVSSPQEEMEDIENQIDQENKVKDSVNDITTDDNQKETVTQDSQPPPIVVVDEEEGEIKDEEQKVRRCRHGRIKRDRPRDKEKDSKGSGHRSRSSEDRNKHREKERPKDKELGNKEISDINSSDVVIDVEPTEIGMH